MSGLKRVANRRDDALTRVQWQQVEILLATYFRGQGYTVTHVGTGATDQRFDGGIDLRLRRGDEHVLVQVKHWNAYKVPHNDVHQLLGLMVNEGATGAVLVTSGEFTKAAIEAATRHGHVQLIDGEELRAMLGPLPEPVMPATNKAEALVAHVGERLLVATEDRIRGHRGRGGSSKWVPNAESAVLIKAVLAVLFILFIVLVMQGALRFALGSLAPRQVSAPAPVPVQAPPLPIAGSVAHDAGAQRPVDGRADPCMELIDKPSGTYVDRCTPAVPRLQPTPAELREQRRKADEAMKLLEQSTPEV